MINAKRSRWVYVASIVAIVFGLVTIIEGGSTLFMAQKRTAAGHVVPFVLWFNFIAGFFYVIAGVALLKCHICARRLSWLIAAATLFVFAWFAIHIIRGGAYEMRTMMAMTLRSAFWIAVAVGTRRKPLTIDSTRC